MLLPPVCNTRNSGLGTHDFRHLFSHSGTYNSVLYLSILGAKIPPPGVPQRIAMAEVCLSFNTTFISRRCVISKPLSKHLGSMAAQRSGHMRCYCSATASYRYWCTQVTVSRGNLKFGATRQ